MSHYVCLYVSKIPGEKWMEGKLDLRVKKHITSIKTIDLFCSLFNILGG